MSAGSRPINIDDKRRAKIVELHVKHGVQVGALAKRFGIAAATVRSILAAAGVEATRNIVHAQSTVADVA